MMQLTQSMASILAGSFPIGAAATEMWQSPAWVGSTWLDPIARSLVHFLWQGTLIALVAALGLVALRRRDARERYAVACLGLLVMALAPILTTAYLVEPALTNATPKTLEALDGTARATVNRTLSMPLDLGADIAIERSISGLESHSSTIFAVWLLGILSMVCMHLGGFQRLRRMRSLGQRVEDGYVETLLRLQARLGVRRSVDFLECPVIQSPMAMGWLKPVILIPSNALFGLSPQQLEAVLAHELGHIRRHDYLVNLGQVLLETLLFYHPAVWWLSHRARVEREHCCDDIAVSLDNNPAVFARALATLETLRPQTPVLALGADGHGSLLSRIQRLAKGDHSPRRSQGLGSSLLAIAIASTVAVCGTVLMVGCPIDQLDAAELSETAAGSELDNGDFEEEQEGLFEDAEDLETEIDEGDGDGEYEDGHDQDTEHDHDEGHFEGDHDHHEGHDHGHRHAEVHEHDFAHSSDGRYHEKAWRQKRAAELQTWAEGTPWSALSASQLEELAGYGFKGDTFAALADAGLRPDTPQLMDLARHGVDAPDVRAAAAAFPGLTVDQLTQLIRSGVDADDLLDLKNAGYGHLNAEEVVRLARYGLDGDDLVEIQQAGYTGLSIDQLVELARHGVDGDDLVDLQQAGQGDLTLEQVVLLAKNGLDGDDILELQNAGFGQLTLEELITLARHGIDGDDIAELKAAGLGNLPLDRVLEMARQGLDGEDFQELRDAGYPSLTLDQALALSRHGVDGDDIQELNQAGMTGLSLDELLELARHGVDGDDIEELQSANLGDLTVAQVIELARHGVDGDDIEELREEGVSIESVEQILELVRSGRLDH